MNVMSTRSLLDKKPAIKCHVLTKEELKEIIKTEILKVTREELQVNSDLFKQYRECLHVH